MRPRARPRHRDQCHGLHDTGLPQCGRFDLTRIEPHAVQLELPVPTAGVVQSATAVDPDDVAGAVDERTVLRVRVGDEGGGCPPGAPV